MPAIDFASLPRVIFPSSSRSCVVMRKFIPLGILGECTKWMASLRDTGKLPRKHFNDRLYKYLDFDIYQNSARFLKKILNEKIN